MDSNQVSYPVQKIKLVRDWQEIFRRNEDEVSRIDSQTVVFGYNRAVDGSTFFEREMPDSRTKNSWLFSAAENPYRCLITKANQGFTDTNQCTLRPDT